LGGYFIKTFYDHLFLEKCLKPLPGMENKRSSIFNSVSSETDYFLGRNILFSIFYDHLFWQKCLKPLPGMDNKRSSIFNPCSKKSQLSPVFL